MELLRLRTRHEPSFNILTKDVRPCRSGYADLIDDYGKKVAQFYRQLGVCGAVWTFPAKIRPEFFETRKPIEYELLISTDRVIAYVDEDSWSAYLYGKRTTFDWSIEPKLFRQSSILIQPPITVNELVATRQYRSLGSPSKYELASETIHLAPEVRSVAEAVDVRMMNQWARRRERGVDSP